MRMGLNLYRVALHLILFGLFSISTAHVLYAADAVPDPAKKKDEKPKEQEFKYSAWCAFRDLNTEYIPPPDTVENREKTTQTRPVSYQWVGFGRRGMWTSVVLELKNTTEKIEFKGSAGLTIEPLSGDGSATTKYETTYGQPFDIGPQTLKQYRFSVLCPEDGWQGRPFIVRGNFSGVPFERTVQINDLDSARSDFVLVVSESAGGYRYLHYKPKDIDEGGFARQVASVEPADLPTRWHDLMAANLIIIDGPPREALTETQWEALRGYVQAGGHLLITAGKDPLRLKGPIEELCGITVGEMAEVASLDGDFALRPSPQQKEWKLPIVNVTVSPKGTPVVHRNKATQLVESMRRFYGTGSVMFLSYSLSDPALQDWPGRSSIPLSILSSERGRRLFRATLEEDMPQQNVRYNRWGGYPQQTQEEAPAGTLVGFRAALDKSFANDTPVQLHSPAMVLAFLLLYLLFAVPVSYFIFGWLGRRELAWIFAPVISAAFSAVGYYIGHHGQIGNLTINEVSVIETGSGMNTGMARTFAAIYSPRRDDYSLSFPPIQLKGGGTLDTLAAPNHLLNPETLFNREVDAPTLAINDLGQSFEVKDLRIQYRSTRHLEFLHRASLGGGLSAKAERNDRGDLTVEVQNNIGTTLLHPTLIYDGKALPLTKPGVITLQDGELFTLDDLSMQDNRWKTVDEAFFGQRTVFASARGKHIPPRVAALNAYMRANMDRFRHGAVIAWADGAPPALPLEIKTGWGEVKQPRYEPITLIVLPLTQRKLRTVDGLPSSLSLFTAQSYDPNNNSWSAVSHGTVAAMNQWVNNSNYSPPPMNDIRNVKILYARLTLPRNHRDLADLGCRMSLALSLDANVRRGTSERPSVKGAPGQRVQTLDGRLYVEALHSEPGGTGIWKPVSDEQFVMNLQNGNVVKRERFPLPLDSVRATRNQEMILRIYFVPNDQNIVNYTLSIRDLQHRIVEK